MAPFYGMKNSDKRESTVWVSAAFRPIVLFARLRLAFNTKELRALDVSSRCDTLIYRIQQTFMRNGGYEEFTPGVFVSLMLHKEGT